VSEGEKEGWAGSKEMRGKRVWGVVNRRGCGEVRAESVVVLKERWEAGKEARSRELGRRGAGGSRRRGPETEGGGTGWNWGGEGLK